ncbi:MAG: helix-turn-helix domain-containing protein [Xanthobacteraceae bacterium]|nr:helix-turn-helix domain-containing protein [Xanthobacteraceae bacterium]
MDPTPEQTRAARQLLTWTQEQLSIAAQVAIMTVKRFEMGETIRPRQKLAIVTALTGAGIEFLSNGTTVNGVVLEQGVAVRLRTEEPSE